MTSKDILSTLSEARDDHLTGCTNSISSYVNEFAELEEASTDVRDGTCCCFGSRRGYLRGRRRTESLGTGEYSRLLDCDELASGKTDDNLKQEIESQRVPPDDRFDDNFVSTSPNSDTPTLL